MFNTDTAREKIFVSENARTVLNDWFDALQERDKRFGGVHVNGRAWRAELRRAEPPYGVMLCEGYHALMGQLGKQMALKDIDRLALALFVSVAVHAKSNNRSGKRSFAAQLGEEIKGRTCLSALRFDRLQQAEEPDVFCRQLIRAVKLRGAEGVNILSLADGIFLWAREWQAREEHQPENIDPFSRNKIRWANEYISTAK
ncbi:type I-E CRISPR-associated protein Cse2/CasB [Enterobacillus tribolii]|uniref:CRISPR-associated Cse2 family protein n=1 Tax=Enterobacillus tribolii TaxID=1487935 RepID=A0A370QRZ8_9GAMM|nr:type I-E CRISPR-associated protein Cse2/CasB [Enterobacillus tribolii]MBW7983477.1 type I-E CRISPR-associated protein Cse2/CasB [Enterobacillus tribolii]RDK92028.1 CRISPR-associated Cse2 family protein [Enterobacillus tribolii]